MPVHKLLLLIALVPYTLALWAGWSHFNDPGTDRRAHGVWGIRVGSILNLLALGFYVKETGILPGVRPFGFYSIYVLVTVVSSRIVSRRMGLERVNFTYMVIPLIALLPLPFVPVDRPLPVRLPAPILLAHLLTVVASLSAFTMAVTSGAMLYVQDRMLKEKTQGILRVQLPPLSDLDRITYRSMATGFGILTLGVGLGFLAMYLLGRAPDVSVDNPMRTKAIMGLTVWGIYGYYLFKRRNRGWRGRTAALFAGAGFAVAAVVSLIATLGIRGATNGG